MRDVFKPLKQSKVNCSPKPGEDANAFLQARLSEATQMWKKKEKPKDHPEDLLVESLGSGDLPYLMLRSLVLKGGS